MTPEQAYAEASQLYSDQKPSGWRTFSMGSIRVSELAQWYEAQVKRAYPYEHWEDAERMFYGDLQTVLSYVNAGLTRTLSVMSFMASGGYADRRQRSLLAFTAKTRQTSSAD